MSINFTGEWEKVKRYLQGEWINRAKPTAIKRVAAYYERQIKLNITTSGTLTGKPFEPLAESTIKRKGSSNPLIDTGDLRNSVRAHVIDENTAFVGVKRGKQHRKGKEDTADIAAIHEFGAIVPGGEIPARPFIRPVINDEKMRKEAGEIFEKTFDEAAEKQ